MVAADGLGVFGELVKMTFDAIGRAEQVTGNGAGGVRSLRAEALQSRMNCSSRRVESTRKACTADQA